MTTVTHVLADDQFVPVMIGMAVIIVIQVANFVVMCTGAGRG